MSVSVGYPLEPLASWLASAAVLKRRHPEEGTPRTPELLADERAEVGEGPVWTSTGNLWWVDILGRRVHCFDPVSRQNTTVFQHPEQNVVFVVEASAGEMVVGLGKTIHRLANGLLLPDPVAVLVSPGESRSLNDAAVDPLGNLWVGVYEPDHIPGAGSLWRITPDGQTTAMVQGLTLPNGVAFTTDGSRLYLADSFQHSVFAFELDLPSGQIGERRTIWFDPDRGFPDGLCIDLDGNLWVAFWGDSCVRVIQPNGNQLDEVRFPVTQVSSCALGDDGWLYVTSARASLSAEEARDQPLAGGLFGVRVGMAGVPVPRFGG